MATASGTIQPAPSPRRRNPASIMLAKLLRAIRGDKYMVDAYPAAWHAAAAARAGDDVVQPAHDGEVGGSVSAGGASEPDTGRQAGPTASRIKER
jgi:hypothetical protein